MQTEPARGATRGNPSGACQASPSREYRLRRNWMTDRTTLHCGTVVYAIVAGSCSRVQSSMRRVSSLPVQMRPQPTRAMGAISAGPGAPAAPGAGASAVAVSGALAGGSLVRRGACFTADGSRLAVCAGAVVRLHSSATGAQLRELAGHGGEVTAVARPPGESDALYTASADGTLRLWDAATGDCLRTLDAPGGVEGVVFAPGAPQQP